MKREPDKNFLTNRQTEEIAKFSLDLSKLSLGSWVFGLLSPTINLSKIFFAFLGLIFAVLFFILGIRLFKETK